MMVTLTLQLSEEYERLVKERAAHEGKTIEDLFLDTLGVRKKGTIHEAMKDLKEGRYDRFETLEDLFADWDKAILEIQNED